MERNKNMNMHIINLSTDESIPLINSDQVIDILYNTDHHNCIFGSSNANDVTKISNEVLDAIKTRNSNREQVGLLKEHVVLAKSMLYNKKLHRMKNIYFRWGK